MRTTSDTKRFEKDYKREWKGPHRADLDDALLTIIALLANDIQPPAKYRDHALTGEYTGHRECHLKPDLLLIYKKPDEKTLRLVRLGSHGELF